MYSSGSEMDDLKRQVLQKVRVDRSCFACMLGGRDRRTLFIVAMEGEGWNIVEVAAPFLSPKESLSLASTSPFLRPKPPIASSSANSSRRTHTARTGAMRRVRWLCS